MDVHEVDPERPEREGPVIPAGKAYAIVPPPALQAEAGLPRRGRVVHLAPMRSARPWKRGRRRCDGSAGNARWIGTTTWETGAFRKRWASLPIYFCPDRHLTLISSRAELRERAVDPAVVDRLPELHRPWIDEVRIRCAECAERTRRGSWTSGTAGLTLIVGFSTLKYLEDRPYWNKGFPARTPSWRCGSRSASGSTP